MHSGIDHLALSELEEGIKADPLTRQPVHAPTLIDSPYPITARNPSQLTVSLCIAGAHFPPMAFAIIPGWINDEVSFGRPYNKVRSWTSQSIWHAGLAGHFPPATGGVADRFAAS